jgi:DNA-binding NarL/FixJ family response regulator
VGPDAGGVTPKTRVVIIDAQPAASELRRLIDDQADLECVGLAATARDGVDLVLAEEPDVVVIDLTVGQAQGGVAGSVKEAWPEARVIALTGSHDIDLVAEAAAAGASGLLQRDTTAVDDVIEAIRSTSGGRVLVDQATLSELVRQARTSTTLLEPSPDAPPITAREREVLMLLGEGLDLKSIARRLGISLHTTRGHVKKLFAKLDAHSQLEAVLAAARWGLVPVRREP